MDVLSTEEFAERVGAEVAATLASLDLDEDREPAEVLGRRIALRYVEELEGVEGVRAARAQLDRA